MNDIEQFTFRGNEGVRIASMRWLPTGTPTAVVVFAHGYTSYALGYREFLQFLVDRGIAVYALDHRGHGCSEGVRASLDRFDDLTDDFQRLLMVARGQQGRLPLYSVGHSLGGLIVYRHALLHPELLDGVVPVSGAMQVGVDVSPLTRKLLIAASKILPEAAVIKYEAPPTPSDDPFEPKPQRDVLAYQGRTRLNLAREIDAAGRDSLDRGYTLELPVLFQHGQDDQVTQPEGSKAAFAIAASADKTIEIWPARHHNLLTDTQWEDVAGSMLQWIAQRARPAYSVAGDSANSTQPSGKDTTVVV